MRRILYLAVLAVVFLSVGKAMAASSDYEISTKYMLKKDGTAEVEAVLSAKNINAEATPTDLKLPIVGSNPKDVTAKYEDGTTLQTDLSEDSKSVTLKNNKDNAGANKTWKIVLSYKTDLGKKYGTTTIFDVPAQNYEGLEVKKEIKQMQAEVDLGVGVARGPKPEITSISLGEQLMTWSNPEGPIKESIGMIFGEEAVADFTLDTTLKNNSWWWQTLEVVMPPDTNQQSVVLESIEPKPSNLRLDLDGNIIAEYSLRPKGSVNVKANGSIHVYNYSYALNGSSGLDSIPDDLKNSYTATNSTWNGDEINADIKTDQPVSNIIEDAFTATVARIPEDKANLEFAQKWSNTLVGELRSLGVPARLVLGDTYTDGYETFNDPIPFAWVEAYAPATGWVTLDPVVQRGSDLYGFSDSQRIALILRGSDPGYPPGELDEYKFTWQEGEPEELKGAVPTSIVSKNNMIFPGFAIKTVDVQMGPGTIVDDTAIDVEGEGVTKLGSLAPLEISTTNLLAIGGDAFSSEKVKYGILDNGEIKEVLSETTTTVNYIPMITGILVIVGVIVLIVVVKKRIAKKSDSSSHKSNMVLAGDDDGLSIDDFDFVDDEPEPVRAPTPELMSTPEPAPVPRPMNRPTPKPAVSHHPKPAQNVTMNPVRTPKRKPMRPPRLIQ